MPSSEQRIFLAHASEDKETIRDLYKRLRGNGYQPWLDEKDILPGRDWQLEIERAINRSWIVLACFSRHSIDKVGYVQKEFRLALNAYAHHPQGTIFLIPLKLEQCDIPDLQDGHLGVRFRDIQWLDYWKETGFSSLLEAINAAKSSSTSNSVEPNGFIGTRPTQMHTSSHLGGSTLTADNKLHRMLSHFERTNETSEQLLATGLVFFRDGEHGNWRHELTEEGRELLEQYNASFTVRQLREMLEEYMRTGDPTDHLVNLQLVTYGYDSRGLGAYRLTQQARELLNTLHMNPNK